MPYSTPPRRLPRSLEPRPEAFTDVWAPSPEEQAEADLEMAEINALADQLRTRDAGVTVHIHQ